MHRQYTDGWDDDIDSLSAGPCKPPGLDGRERAEIRHNNSTSAAAPKASRPARLTFAASAEGSPVRDVAELPTMPYGYGGRPGADTV